MPRLPIFRLLATALLLIVAICYPTHACCPAPHLGDWVINADQTVIMIWDPAAKRQHFIRKASFDSQAKDFGFLIPSPTQPELSESGEAAFSALHTLTAPRIVPGRHPRLGGCNVACSKSAELATAEVRVLEEKLVAGFQASVLEADNVDVLTTWLKEHGYAYSPEVAQWAAPYVADGWKITALKVASVPTPGEEKPRPAIGEPTVEAKALRLSFDTDRPLFPYREPNYQQLAGDNNVQLNQLKAAQRLLRIYFLSNAKYRGELTKEQPWTGRISWAGKLTAEQRKQLLEQLALPPETGPAEFYLTEFEDLWPYRVAPADVYFTETDQQDDVRRPDAYVQGDSGGDISLAILAVFACMPLVVRRRRA